MPKRIQRKRTKGWRMPDGAVYVGRTAGAWAQFKPFANPFRIGGLFKIGTPGQTGFSWLEAMPGYEDQTFTKVESAEQAVEMFREYRRRYPYSAEEVEPIKGRDLACWCALDSPCHADVLLEIANAAEVQR